MLPLAVTNTVGTANAGNNDFLLLPGVWTYTKAKCFRNSLALESPEHYKRRQAQGRQFREGQNARSRLG